MAHRAGWTCMSRSIVLARHLGKRMRLNPPTIIIFLISFLLASVALITKLGFIPVPRYLPHQEFWLSITAYFTLMVGNLVKGL